MDLPPTIEAAKQNLAAEIVRYAKNLYTGRDTIDDVAAVGNATDSLIDACRITYSTKYDLYTSDISLHSRAEAIARTLSHSGDPKDQYLAGCIYAVLAANDTDDTATGHDITRTADQEYVGKHRH